jgi:hypothetical protein
MLPWKSAECVMLNKGPHILRAVQVLDDILRRMQFHQVKKTAMLRKLHVAESGESRSASTGELRSASSSGRSFVQRDRDVEDLRRHLHAANADHVGIVLKIETRRAFERLSELAMAALQHPQSGIMIARGDLAVECGYERLAEVQEEILWISEAAHLPVIWATQVLESLAKTGQPSRGYGRLVSALGVDAIGQSCRLPHAATAAAH